MRATLDYYRSQLRAAIAVDLQYRAMLLIWLIGAILEPLIYLVVWNTVAAAQGGAVQGMTPGDFAAYFIVVLIVNQLTFSWTMWDYEDLIENGTFSARLLRPIHPIHADVAENIAYKLVTLVVLVPTVIIMVVFFNPTFHWEPVSVLLFFPSLILAFVLRFTLEWALAMSAFWTTKTSAVNQLYFVVFLFFSGRIAPLTLFPPAFLGLATVLPFRWMLSFPVDLLLGVLSPSEIAVGFVMQSLWTIAAIGVLGVVWRFAVERYGAVGG